MSYRALQRMDPDIYRDRLVETLWEIIEDPSVPMFGLYESGGHSGVHYALPEDALVNRVVHEDVPAASSFLSDEEARQHIAFAALNSVQDICDWFFAERSEYPQDREFRRLTLTLDMKEDVGYGIDTKFTAKKTSAISVILDRDFSPESMFGFRVRTAYPDIVHMPQCTEMVRQIPIDEILAKNDLFAGPIEKLAVLYRATHSELNAYYSLTRNHEPELSYHHPTRGGMIDIYIREQDYRIYQRVPGHNRKISHGEYGLMHPDGNRILTNILRDRDALVKGHPLHIEQKTAGQER